MGQVPDRSISLSLYISFNLTYPNLFDAKLTYPNLFDAKLTYPNLFAPKLSVFDQQDMGSQHILDSAQAFLQT
jgi:hypothetical protein